MVRTAHDETDDADRTLDEAAIRELIDRALPSATDRASTRRTRSRSSPGTDISTGCGRR
jgi:hypothetical protein